MIVFKAKPDVEIGIKHNTDGSWELYHKDTGELVARHRDTEGLVEMYGFVTGYLLGIEKWKPTNGLTLWLDGEPIGSFAYEREQTTELREALARRIRSEYATPT